MNIHTVWAGGPLTENAKEGLGRIKDAYPNAARYLWVQHRMSDPNGRRQLAEMKAEGKRLGFTVHSVQDHLKDLTKGLSYGTDTVRDIISWEMACQGAISVKDLTTYLVLARHGGLAMDTSVTVGKGKGVEPRGDFRVPMLSPDGIARQMGHPGAAPYSRNSANRAEPHELPHLDVWAVHAKPGTKGQEVMRAAADRMVGQYAELINAGSDQGLVTRWPMSEGDKSRKGLTLAVVRADSELGTKWNAKDPYRNQLVGEFAMAALYEGINSVYGKDVGSSKYELARIEVPARKWPEITWQGSRTDGRTFTIPDMAMTKTYGGSWREPNARHVSRAEVSEMKLPRESAPPGHRPPPPGTKRSSAPAAKPAPGGTRGTRSSSLGDAPSTSASSSVSTRLTGQLSAAFSRLSASSGQSSSSKKPEPSTSSSRTGKPAAGRTAAQQPLPPKSAKGKEAERPPFRM
jgi:hypothetical protein